MNEIETKQRLGEALDLFFRSLGPEFQEELVPNCDDPLRLVKPQCKIDHWHVRIHPKTKLPRTFWTDKWCYYEMGIGQNGGDGLEIATCAFTWGPEQKSQGGGVYRKPIGQILTCAEAASKGAFRIRLVGPTGATQMLCCSFRGYVNPVAMAEKMKWLVEHTLKEIQAVPSL